MQPKTAATPQPHMGRKIEKIRRIKGIKQDVLAKMLGIDQSALSRLEGSEQVDDDKLKMIADALEMTVDAIKNFNEESVINYIQNNYDSATGGPQGGSFEGENSGVAYHFNPLDKLMESVEENRKLYQALLDEKDSKIRMLEEMVRGK